jgi:hypothetical protein
MKITTINSISVKPFLVLELNIITTHLSESIHPSPPLLLAEDNGGGYEKHEVGAFETPTF